MSVRELMKRWRKELHPATRAGLRERIVRLENALRLIESVGSEQGHWYQKIARIALR